MFLPSLEQLLHGIQVVARTSVRFHTCLACVPPRPSKCPIFMFNTSSSSSSSSSTATRDATKVTTIISSLCTSTTHTTHLIYNKGIHDYLRKITTDTCYLKRARFRIAEQHDPSSTHRSSARLWAFLAHRGIAATAKSGNIIGGDVSPELSKTQKAASFCQRLFSYLVLPEFDVSNTLAGATVKELAYWNR